MCGEVLSRRNAVYSPGFKIEFGRSAANRPHGVPEHFLGVFDGRFKRSVYLPVLIFSRFILDTALEDASKGMLLASTARVLIVSSQKHSAS